MPRAQGPDPQFQPVNRTEIQGLPVGTRENQPIL